MNERKVYAVQCGKYCHYFEHRETAERFTAHEEISGTVEEYVLVRPDEFTKLQESAKLVKS